MNDNVSEKYTPTKSIPMLSVVAYIVRSGYRSGPVSTTVQLMPAIGPALFLLCMCNERVPVFPVA